MLRRCCLLWPKSHYFSDFIPLYPPQLLILKNLNFFLVKGKSAIYKFVGVEKMGCGKEQCNTRPKLYFLTRLPPHKIDSFCGLFLKCKKAYARLLSHEMILFIRQFQSRKKCRAMYNISFIPIYEICITIRVGNYLYLFRIRLVSTRVLPVTTPQYLLVVVTKCSKIKKCNFGNLHCLLQRLK